MKNNAHVASLMSFRNFFKRQAAYERNKVGEFFLEAYNYLTFSLGFFTSLLTRTNSAPDFLHFSIFI